MTSPLAAYHPDLALVGAGLAAAGLLLGRVRRGVQLEVAIIGVAWWATRQGRTDGLAVAVLVLAAVASLAHPPEERRAASARRTATALAAGGAIAVVLTGRAEGDPGPWVLLACAATCVGALGVLTRGAARLSAWSAALLVVACAATFGGAPDTEVAVATGASIAAVALGSALIDAVVRTPVGPALLGWATPCWVAHLATTSYRGRPAGLTAGAVACAAIVAAALLAARGEGAPRRRLALALAFAALATIGAARTIGLTDRTTVATAAVGAVLAAAVLASAWWATSVREPDVGRATPGPARTPPA